MQVQAVSQNIVSTTPSANVRTQAENLPINSTSEHKKAASEPPTASGSAAEVENATKKLQSFVDTVRRDIQFSLDQDSGRTVVKVIDKETKDTLMQFPSEEALSIAKSLDKLQGLLVRQKA